MYQKTTVVGNAGSDATIKWLESGKAVSNFSVAVNNPFTKKTTWFRVTAWDKLAETCEKYVKKGTLVLIEGELESDEKGNPPMWSNDKGTFSNFQITVREMRLLGSRGEGQDTSEPNKEETPEVPF